ncbi:hypothetical protein [Pedobacter endophyticus]|uniref:Uncharacterized protein n=1 Tax=Pedobacter endophyticus TaxID=2789740 RepID=A0A7S9L1F5_9SPHI|nr:hypothetical protein [Pedobacter endophyticus]QPH40707.1 hypothetical protein IZT61_05405 [Pedobacter endophyticus]
MANPNRSEKEPTVTEITNELVKKSQELREKHQRTQEVFNKLKERTERFLTSDKAIK